MQPRGRTATGPRLHETAHLAPDQKHQADDEQRIQGGRCDEDIGGRFDRGEPEQDGQRKDCAGKRAAREQQPVKREGRTAIMSRGEIALHCGLIPSLVHPVSLPVRVGGHKSNVTRALTNAVLPAEPEETDVKMDSREDVVAFEQRNVAKLQRPSAPCQAERELR